MEYEINKGIGKPVEFKGLKAQYLLIFVLGLLGLFILFIVLYMIGINETFCIVLLVVAATTLVVQTFRLNKKYGQHGLMKLWANKHHPRFLIHRRTVHSFFNKKL